MDCSAGPPTMSDTGIPTDQNSVGGDYVLILASSTKIRLANKNEEAFGAQQYAPILAGIRALHVFFWTTVVFRGARFCATSQRVKAHRIGAFRIASRRFDLFLRH
jgi:hypothetical protein